MQPLEPDSPPGTPRPWLSGARTRVALAARPRCLVRPYCTDPVVASSTGARGRFALREPPCARTVQRLTVCAERLDRSHAVSRNPCWGSVSPLCEFSDPVFRNSLSFRNFWAKAFRREKLAQSGSSSSIPVVTRHGVSRPGQSRDKSWAGDASFGVWILVIFGSISAAVITPDPPRDGRSRPRSEIDTERRTRYENASREIDAAVSEAHQKLPRSLATAVGAVYARFSSWSQDSTEDQVRQMLKFAVENGIFVPSEHVYFDLAVKGYKNNRQGLNALRDLLREKKVKVLLLFATNRLFRKVYRTLEFVEQVVTEHGIRCVFVKSAIDTANKDQWHMLLHMRAMMDEFQVKVNVEHIRAALEGLFLEGYVRGTLALGYRGEPVPSKLTKRGLPRLRIVIDADELKIVTLIFEWFVHERKSLVGIAQKLNAMPDVPQPRKSNGNGWNRNSVRAVLRRAAYWGLWTFSTTEKTFLPSKDYTRQLRAKSRSTRLLSKTCGLFPTHCGSRHRRCSRKTLAFEAASPRKEDADQSLRILSGLCWCPEHDRPLRAGQCVWKVLGLPDVGVRDATFVFQTASQSGAAASLRKVGRSDSPGRESSRTDHFGCSSASRCRSTP
jgi:DNA invertase Pin-like site-specific DNA recombinase